MVFRSEDNLQVVSLFTMCDMEINSDCQSRPTFCLLIHFVSPKSNFCYMLHGCLVDKINLKNVSRKV